MMESSQAISALSSILLLPLFAAAFSHCALSSAEIMFPAFKFDESRLDRGQVSITEMENDRQFLLDFLLPAIAVFNISMPNLFWTWCTYISACTYCDNLLSKNKWLRAA